MRRITSIALIVASVVATIACAPASAPAHALLTAKAASAIDCPDEFKCHTVEVPLDHLSKGKYSKQTIDIAYAVAKARDASQRMGALVILVGGPGGSGLEDADITNYSDQERDAFDIVFFDQRGVGQSNDLDCPDAYNEYDMSSGLTAEQEDTLRDEAKTFAKSCIREMDLGDVEELNFYNTRQAAYDLDALRKALGEDKLWIMGESYGTQLAQWYAALFPKRVAGMVIDGSVNLLQANVAFRETQMDAYNELLALVLGQCDRDARCRSDANGSLIAAYDVLKNKLDAGPIEINFPNEKGKTSKLELTRDRFDSEVGWLLDYEWGRAALVRGIAAATRDDLTLLARAFSFTSYPPDRKGRLDSDTPGESDAMYYIVSCGDDAFFPGNDDAQADAFLHAGDAVEGKARLPIQFYNAELTCAYWPNTATGYAPYDPKAAANVPTLIIGAKGDATTPYSQSPLIHKQLPNSTLLTVLGGSHVSNNGSNACVNKILDEFLLGEREPAGDEVFCEDVFARDYVPIAPRSAKAFANALAGMTSFEDQAFELPEYYLWDSEDPADVGCSFGGMLTYAYDDPIETMTLKKCALTSGFVVTGTCTYDYDIDRFSCDVKLGGDHTGEFEYAHAGRKQMLNGTVDGKPTLLTQDDLP